MLENNAASSGKPRPTLFNTPFECGFRLLFVLSACRPQRLGLQRLISYDYLLVHSGDVERAPDSLHPAVPNRGTEWIVKRDLVDQGLSLMLARDLIQRHYTGEGMSYSGSDLTTAFIDLLESSYARGLRARSAWLYETFGTFTDERLQTFMSAQVGRWGAEFDTLSAVKDLEL